jgi:serine/threonine protein kinase/formylglycine-generating enzyme required for sulfatase activity
MLVRLLCPNPNCQASFDADDSILGSAIHCQKCGTRFVAEDSSLRVSAPPPTQSELTNLVSLALDLPSPFGRYRLIRRLGRGGMGAVYLAHDDELDRDVALKVPSTSTNGDDRELLERFQREKKAAARLERHPNFCPIFDAGEFQDRPYLAMAYIEGNTLNSRVNRENPMDPRQAAEIVRKLALAMADAHDKGILHRDLKPANIMIDSRDEPIIMDFGLARSVSSNGEELTTTGAMLGTLPYMSLEQVQCDKAAIGPATDIYSLGVIFYELLTGRRPFEGPPHSVLTKILTEEPLPPSAHRPELDPQFVRIVRKASAKAIADRYASMREFAAAISEALSDGSAPVVPKLKRKPRLRIVLEAASLLGLLAAIVYFATDTGSFQIEGIDSKMEVRVDGREVAKERLDKPLKLKAGEHGLEVIRGETLVKAPQTFTIERGKRTVVRVEFISPKEKEPLPVVIEVKATVAKPSPPIDLSEVLKALSSVASKVKNSVAKAEPLRLVKPITEAAKDLPAQPEAVAKKDSVEPQPPPPPLITFEGQTAGESKRFRLGEIEASLSWCPPGRFTMGSPPSEKDRHPNEGPVNVTLTQGFWMLQTEVPQDLYEAVTGKNPSNFVGPKNPAESVRYVDAVDFAFRLTQRLHVSGDLPQGWEVRLPTEAQWEYAARAGSQTLFPFGNRLSSREANFDGNYPYGGEKKGPNLAKTTAVGSYKPNAWGLYDTIGNVWEWCLDGYQEGPSGGADAFESPAKTSYRVIRGGCWSDVARSCRSAKRVKVAASNRDKYLGFRIAVVPLGNANK